MSMDPLMRKRSAAGLLILVVAFQVSLSVFFISLKPVNAFVVEDPAVQAELLRHNIQVERIEPAFTTTMRIGLVQAVLSAVGFFLQRLASDFAVWVASGGQGQGSLIFQKGWKQYLQDTALDAVGDFAGTLSEGLNIPGVNLCNPSLSIILKIQLGLFNQVNPPSPRCSWNQISSDWSNFVSSVGSGEVLRNIGVMFEPGQSGLSAAFEVNNIAISKVQEAVEANKLTRSVNQGFKSINEFISGNTKTPAETTQKVWNTAYTAGLDLNKVTVEAALINSDVWQGMLRMVLATFTSTLLNQMISKVMSGFFSIGDLLDEGVGNSEAVQVGVGGREAAREVLADIFTPQVTSVDIYDVLSEFAACPQNRGPNNCVMDQQFAAAVRQATANRPLTVQEAIDQGGLLQGNWKLISSGDRAKNQDPYCYTSAYCYSNLVKLRHARILPIGWELAANSDQNSTGSPVTLQFVINNFNTCNRDGRLDAEHPWCHLIDPNWVLKYPRTQCRVLGYGPTLESNEGNTRAQVCVDAPSCNAEDDQGNCIGGWGYCTKEKNVWRFDGDVCPTYYNTCQTFNSGDPRDAHQISVKTNTVDFGICNADNAGCKWYSTRQEYRDSPGDKVCIGGQSAGTTCTTDAQCGTGGVCLPDQTTGGRQAVPDTISWEGAKTCQSGPDTGSVCSQDTDCAGAAVGGCAANPVTRRIYLNRRAAQCDAASAGCSELVPKSGGVTLNLVRNSSFEADTVRPTGTPDFWDKGGTPEYSIDSSNSFDGSDAIRFNAATQSMVQRVNISPNRFYTMSFYARRVNGSDRPTAELKVDFRSSNNTTSYRTSTGASATIDLSRYFVTESTCTRSGSSVLVSSFTPSAESGGAPIYERRSCTFTSPEGTAYVYLTVDGSGGSGVWVDAVQLEESEAATAYYGDGYSGAGASERVYLKKPPAVCTGNASDPQICLSYAQVCAATEVGCEFYTPALGDPVIPGIARASDQCPASCVGYETFREEPSYFDESGDYPIYFIPQTARACSAANAGCDEFTRIATGAGAEQREDFRYLRLCEDTTEAGLGTFYTWEGSDTTGYQLKTWQLKVSNLTSASGILSDPTGGVAPCTEYNASSHACGDGARAATCTRADLSVNPDCREFYDTLGNIHYRLYSHTIIKSDSCVDYRKTESNETDCEASGGRWAFATSQCFYKSYLPESRSCPATENGCRLYTGNAGRNVENVFNDDFEGGTASGWSNSSVSNESLRTGEHSLRKTSSPMEKVQAWQNINGKTFLMSFWAKGTPGQNVDVKFRGAPGKFGSSPLSSDWRFYQFGPVKVDWNAPSVATATCSLGSACTSAGGCPCPATGATQCRVANGASSCIFDKLQISTGATDLFLDNIILKSVSANIAVVKNSWRTPAACDATSEGAYRAQAMLGCAEYRDRANNTLYLKSFSQLCRESVVGCRAFFDTHNSTSVYAETYNFICIRPDKGSGPCSVDPDGTGSLAAKEVCTIPAGRDRCTFGWDGELLDPAPNDFYSAIDSSISLKYINGTGGGATLPFFYATDLAVVPNDSSVYLVDAQDKRCSAEAKGCAALGRPTFTADQSSVASLADAYFLNRPDEYDQTLCTDESLMCEAWRTPEGSEMYFKDPLQKTCEYRPAPANLTAPGVTWGWFRTGTNTPCYSEYRISERENGIWSNRAVCSLGSACTNSAGCPCPAAATITTAYCVVANGFQSCLSYQGWVGQCTNQYSSCTEFLDASDYGRVDTSANYTEWPNGKPYTYIDNDRLDDALKDRIDRCEGQASQKWGCALFNDTSNSVLSWNAGATYLKSQKNNYAKVAPVSCVSGTPNYDARYCKKCWSNIPGPGGSLGNDYCENVSDCPEEFNDDCVATTPANDTNRILKVRRDRDCAEWLTCTSSQQAWDQRTNQFKDVCYDVGACTQYNPSVPSLCSAWAPQSSGTNLRTKFTGVDYSERNVSWNGVEYSGYSIPEKLPVEELEPINVGRCSDISAHPGFACSSNGDCASVSASPRSGIDVCNQFFVLGRKVSSCEIGPILVTGGNCHPGTCGGSGILCGTNGECPGREVCNRNTSIIGKCYNDICAQNAAGAPLVVNDQVRTDDSSRCRAYPEVDSPFPNKVVSAWSRAGARPTEPLDENSQPLSSVSGFTRANLCRAKNDCECSYKKVVYGNANTIYYNADNEPNAPIPRICDGGSLDGQPCTNDASCNPGGAGGSFLSNGTCREKTREDIIYGLNGFCLENDSSININGDQNQNACLSWWPIDQIPAATDIYGKFTGAGFDPTQATFYCAKSEVTKSIRSTELHCENPASWGGCNSDNECFNNADDLADNCPPGYFLYTSGCEEERNETCGAIIADKCSWSCVPLGSVHAKDGSGNTTLGSPDWSKEQPCGPWDLPTDWNQWYKYGETARNDTRFGPPQTGGNWTNTNPYNDQLIAYWPKDNAAADSPFLDCVKRGVPIASDRYNNAGRSFDVENSYPELSCKFVVETSRSNPVDSNKAWTNRVWTSSTFPINTAGVVPENLGYVYDTGLIIPFGQSDGSILDPTRSIGSSPVGPILIQMCADTGTIAATSYVLPHINQRCPSAPDRRVNPNPFEWFTSSGESLRSNRYARSYMNTGIEVQSGTNCSGPADCNEGATCTGVRCAKICDNNSECGGLGGECVKGLIPEDDVDSSRDGIQGYCKDGTPAPCGSGLVSTNVCNVGPRRDEVCQENNDCYVFSCRRTLTGASGVCAKTRTITPIGESDINLGKNRIKQIFAKSYIGFEWSDVAGGFAGSSAWNAGGSSLGLYSGAYQTITSTAQTWDITETGIPVGQPGGPAVPTSPRVFAVGVCTGNSCAAGIENSVTVNGRNSDNVSGDGGQLPAALRFFAHANSDQMPIRKVLIDWGDGRRSGSTADTNYYKNHNGTSALNTNPCHSATDFGDSSAACDPSPFQFNHTYRCDNATLNGLLTCSASLTTNCKKNVSGRNVCVFKPRVFIKDNWGWCASENSSGCPGNPGDSGCYDATGNMQSTAPDANECNPDDFPRLDSTKNPWVYFDGEIQVAP